MGTKKAKDKILSKVSVTPYEGMWCKGFVFNTPLYVMCGESISHILVWRSDYLSMVWVPKELVIIHEEKSDETLGVWPFIWPADIVKVFKVDNFEVQ